jgi:hypothetical protein
MTTQSSKQMDSRDPRVLVALAMYAANKLNDETQPADRYKDRLYS